MVVSTNEPTISSPVWRRFCGLCEFGPVDRLQCRRRSISSALSSYLGAVFSGGSLCVDPIGHDCGKIIDARSGEGEPALFGLIGKKEHAIDQRMAERRARVEAAQKRAKDTEQKSKEPDDE